MSFYVDRYFLVITPAIILILATGVIGQKSNFSKELCFSNVMLGMMVLMATGYGLFHTKFNEKYFTRDDWRSMANIIRHEAQEEDVLVSCTDGWRLALDYYGVGATFDADKAYFNYPKNTDFNNVVPNYKHIWIPTNNVRLPQHHLGYSYNFPLAVDILPTEVQTWFSQHKPDVFSVAGITTYRYNLDDDVTDFNILIDWHCSQPKP
ncbi:MAG: hypothetical protein B6242_12935 [Anaerolineaceae bacterium 4572_78]|nr:MAG: hypothetical protein B6242_12935 [Anaerolineaceae bacterium 4572_78]